jgi:hypothetical protein
LGINCLAGHGDDHYEYADPAWIEVQKHKVNQNDSSKNVAEQ